MRKIIFIAPDWLSVEGESVLRQNLTGLSRLAERGDLFKLSPLPNSATPESQVLGLAPNQVELAQGPLMISALRADPPERSTHFHLSLMSLDDARLHQHQFDLPPEQVDIVMARAKSLNTKTLTIVAGEGIDHGLVWEGLGDLGTFSPAESEGKDYRDCLPSGDNEPALRRFIDDSVNLLGELDLNQERIDQGLQPINILWPWGHGVRVRVPNLALKRGEPTQVVSPSLRLAGLTRLVGYRHDDRSLLRRGLNSDWRLVAQRGLDSKTVIIWTPIFQELRARDQIEEASWLSHEIDKSFIEPILESSIDVPTSLTVLAPSSSGNGLGLSYQSKMNAGNVIPFDERALDERLSQRQMHEVIETSLVS